MGEGFHNYHHTFPYDYGTSEWGFRINATTLFLDAMAAVGLVYDSLSGPELAERPGASTE